MAKALRYVLAPAKTVAEGAAIEGDAIVASAGPRVRGQLRCPICGRRCECHDHEPTRRWRAMDLARSKCFLEYGPARVTCPEHGVRVERVPWARHGSRYTRDFEDWVACLAVRCCMSAVSRIARVEWHSVGGICGRACDETGAQGGASRLDGPRRIGIDEAHETFLDAGSIAEEEGAAAIALHARTVQQAYSGRADWSRIAELKRSVGIPVLGNGDLWEAEDALRMMTETGCDGVVIGRGCLGRPWLFGDLAAAFAGEPRRARPTLGEVGAMIIRHAELLTVLRGERGVVDLRKHMAWYFKGYPVGELRRRFAMVTSLDELRTLVGLLDADQPFPVRELGTPRGRQGGPRGKVVLPHGWYADTSGCQLDLSDAEDGVSGG